MKITKVSVTYGELRSTGFPLFSNKRHEITLEAKLEPGDTPRAVRDRLLLHAKNYVAEQFGDLLAIRPADDMDVPL